MLNYFARRALRTIGFASLLVLALTASTALAAQGEPHLLFFTNDGCAPCKQVEPHIESLQRLGYPVTTINIDENQNLVQQFGIRVTPTILLFDGNRKLRGRKEGLVDGQLMKQWFAQVGMPQPPAAAPAAPRQQGSGWATVDPSPGVGIKHRQFTPDSNAPAPEPQFATNTMHQGTAQPESEAERRAMNATVRLKVEDTGGYSYATGTVIHAHGNEALVMTCGHVFRDSQGTGVITVEYDFYRNPRRARGRLIDYDADARDVALVAIRTDEPLQPAILADASASCQSGTNVFSIGCDRGDDPTIRRTRIKRTAKYDGARKYDIYGRPVVGRSGGGLFTFDGRLIGVCNAAAVEVDEGIYSSIDTLHWQVASVGLGHLFENLDRPTAVTSGGEIRGPRPDRFADRRLAAGSDERAPGQRAGVGSAGMQRIGTAKRGGQAVPQTFARNPTPNNRSLEQRISVQQEVIIKVNAGNGQVREIKISDPTPELIEYLNRLQ